MVENQTDVPANDVPVSDIPAPAVTAPDRLAAIEQRIEQLAAHVAEVERQVAEAMESSIGPLRQGIEDIKANQTHRLLDAANQNASTPVERLKSIEACLARLDGNFKPSGL